MPRRMRDLLVELVHIHQITVKCPHCEHYTTYYGELVHLAVQEEVIQCRNCRRRIRYTVWGREHRKCLMCGHQPKEIQRRQAMGHFFLLCQDCAPVFDQQIAGLEEFSEQAIEQLPQLIRQKLITGKKVDLKRLLPGGHNEDNQ